MKNNISKNKNLGFTLIELMIVISIIGIMVSLALPRYSARVDTARTKQAIILVEGLKSDVKEFYKQKQYFPKNNQEAGIPVANKIISTYVSEVILKDGAFHIKFGQKTPQSITGKIITVRPIYVKDSPKSPISWICGNASIPKGMVASGENKTNLENTRLPVKCRV